MLLVRILLSKGSEPSVLSVLSSLGFKAWQVTGWFNSEEHSFSPDGLGKLLSNEQKIATTRTLLPRYCPRVLTTPDRQINQAARGGLVKDHLSGFSPLNAEKELFPFQSKVLATQEIAYHIKSPCSGTARL
ncbi:hypothetical protein AHAS_Ahas17G0032400 [Arachis hypogaea]